MTKTLTCLFIHRPPNSFTSILASFYEQKVNKLHTTSLVHIMFMFLKYSIDHQDFIDMKGK